MKIALIGLGAMGLPFAQRLARAEGVELSIFDVRSERLDEAAGLGRRASSLADAAGGADAVLTVLPADSHVEAVAAEIGRAGHPGQLYVDFSTIGPATIERVASRLAAVGMKTVSVAITRGTAAAQAGKLALFVGGDAASRAALAPAFDALADEVLVVGGLGAAKALKIANNMVLGCLGVATCEALVLAYRIGASPELLTASLAAGGADSWALRNHIVKNVLTGDLGPGHFSTRNMAKDMRLFVDLAGELGLPAFLAGVVSAAYRGVIANGSGEDYHPIVIRWLERGAGVPPVTAPRASEPALDAPARDRLAVICRGVVAVQAIANQDALRVVARTGIAPREAAAFLESGSAGNASLPEVASRMARDPAWAPATLVEDLAGAVDLAAALDVPALMFEVGRQVAVAQRAAAASSRRP